MLAVTDDPRMVSNMSRDGAGSLNVMPRQLNSSLYTSNGVVVTSNDVGNLYAEPAFRVYIS